MYGPANTGDLTSTYLATQGKLNYYVQVDKLKTRSGLIRAHKSLIFLLCCLLVYKESKSIASYIAIPYSINAACYANCSFSANSKIFGNITVV